MINFPTSLVYVSFYMCVFGACYVTGSAWCLWALIWTPSNYQLENLKEEKSDDK